MFLNIQLMMSEEDQECVDTMNRATNAYEALGLSRDADENIIKKRYKILSKKLHPDKNKCEGATTAFQKLHSFYNELIKEIHQESEGLNSDNNDSDEDIFDEEEEDRKEFERMQSEWQREYTKNLFYRAKRGEQDEKIFYVIFVLILAVMVAIGAGTISSKHSTNRQHVQQHSLPSVIFDPLRIINQTIFFQECFRTSTKSCVILMLPQPKFCSRKLKEQQIQMFGKSLKNLNGHKIGRLWTQYGDQPEIEKAIEHTNLFYPPFLVFANFRKHTFWVKKLSDLEDSEGIPTWVQSCAKGKEVGGNILNTTTWSRWSSIDASSLPNIEFIEGDGKYSPWKHKLGSLAVQVLPILCTFNLF